MKKVVVIFSGGQDSTTCLYWAYKKFGKENVEAMTFNYGQKHSVELDQAKKICEMNGTKLTIVDISFLGTIVESALTSNGDVNEKNAQGLPASFVPNRNQLFITLAHSYAQKIGAKNLVTGVCQTDYSGYPDCREEFIYEIQRATNLGAFGAIIDEHGTILPGTNDAIIIHTPLMDLTKAETFKLAKQVNALDEVIEHSHTCYNGDRSNKHEWGYGCDNCPACELRKKGWKEYKQSLIK
jgi:7-cyano-7-deazaguanine synthase